MAKFTVWIGSDPHQTSAFAVAFRSAQSQLTVPTAIMELNLQNLREQGLYSRPTETRDGRLWDVISQAPMSTEFAISRFLVPSIAKAGWALFMDSDVLVRADLTDLFGAIQDRSEAILCVQHDHRPTYTRKMNDQVQTSYPRKNWSSVVAFNCEHPANTALTTELVNSVPGRDLHRFCWLPDDELGALDPKWNWLVGHSDPMADPAIVHFTDGTPDMPGFENSPFADEWRQVLQSVPRRA